jgi:hypothetical protein
MQTSHAVSESCARLPSKARLASLTRVLESRGEVDQSEPTIVELHGQLHPRWEMRLRRASVMSRPTTYR